MTCDALRQVFTSSALSSLVGISSPSKELRQRLEILSASGPILSRDPEKEWRVRWLRARKAAWDAYLTSAFACGLLGTDSGGDLVARLRGRSDDGFRSAMAECSACWFLAGKLRLGVQPTPKGRGSRILEFVASYQGGEFYVEVKSPRSVNVIGRGGAAPNYSKKLTAILKEANRQFDKGARNLLILVPEFSPPLDRMDLTEAFVAIPALTYDVDPVSGRAVTKPETKLYPEGGFLRIWGNEPTPRFTRLGGVLAIDECVRHRGNDCWMESNGLLVHNPAASEDTRIPTEIWGDTPQFMWAGDVLRWSDGHRIF